MKIGLKIGLVCLIIIIVLIIVSKVIQLSPSECFKKPEISDIQYGSLLDEIMQESAKERHTAEGAYIAPSENANMMKYIKKLLAQVFLASSILTDRRMTGTEK